MKNQAASPPSPALFMQSVNSYQRTAAMKAAIELDLFSAIAAGAGTAAEVAARCNASERGVRILCDYLVLLGFLNRTQDRYALTPDSAAFLNWASPAYLGGAIEFLLSPPLLENFAQLAAAVRKGGTIMPLENINPDPALWVNFARAMAGLMAGPAELLAQLVNGNSEKPLRVLDIAAGHGLFGLAIARLNPAARIVAQDLAPVLDVAAENARAANVADRFETLPGDAFQVDLGQGYDVVLLTNFLHHFDPTTCETLLRKVHASLAPGGCAVALEFIADESRTSPPEAIAFALTMLATTPSGDAFTFAEYNQMFRNAGFARSELHPLPPTMERVVIAQRS